MSIRKNGKLKRLIALAINLQLVVTTSAFAKGEQSKGIATAANVMNKLGGVAMQGMQQMQMQQMQQMQQQQAAMMQSQYGIKPVDPSQVPKILTDNGCLVLPARPDYPTDKCQDYDATQAESGYYTALLNVAENNQNDITNFLTSGHQRFTTQGLGCYEKALKQFTAALNSRVEALNKLEEAITTEVAAFEKISEKDVQDLKKGNALLEGKPAELIKDIKFEDKFADPQCKSFFTKTMVKAGAQKGFRGIQNGLAKVINQAKPDQFKGKQSSIKKDIKKIARKIGNQVKKKKTLSINPSDLSIKSKYFKSNNSTLGAILKESSTNIMSEVQNVQKELSKVVEDKPELKKMIAGIESDTIDLDNALYVYERQEKNACLNKYLKSNFGGVNGLKSKLKDPNISAKANRESDSAFKNELVSILGNDLNTIEEKIALIKKSEGKRGNNRWTLTTGKSVSIEGKTIGASTRLRASDMVSIFTDNCKAKFDHQRNSKGKSSRSAMKALKNYKVQFKNLQKKYATTLEEKIISDMINCPAEQTEGTGASSCTGALSMNSGNFCLRTANICAGNMLACKDKADKIVETTRAEQKVIATRYKKNMDSLKAKLAQTFMATSKIMEGQARQLDGMYQMGTTYNIPMKLNLDLKTGKLLGNANEGIDPSLMIEDPKEYLKAVKDNIKELRESVQAQNNQILNGAAPNKKKGMVTLAGAGQVSKYKGLKGEIMKYQDNYKIQQTEWGKIANSCSKMIDQYNQMITEQNNAQQKEADEYNKKVGDICKKVQGYNSNSEGLCGEASKLGDDIFEIAAVAGDSAAATNLKSFDKVCNSFNSESTSKTVDPNFFGKNSGRDIASYTTPDKFCEKFVNQVPECITISRLKSKYKYGACANSLADMIDPEDDVFKNLNVFVYTEYKSVDANPPEKGKIAQNEGEKDEVYSSQPPCRTKHPDLDGLVGPHKKQSQCIPKMAGTLTKAQKEFLAKNDPDFIMKTAKCYDLDKLGSNDKKNFEEDLKVVAEYIAQGKRAKQISQIGQINVSFCNANNDDQNIGKDFMSLMGQQQDRSLAGGFQR